MEKKKNNKPIIAIVVALVVGLVGGTIAYFTSEETLSNQFKTKPYSTEITETFVSPDNWVPGTTTEKTVVAKNTGDVDVAVRVSFEEEWKDSSNSPLELTTNGVTAAIINYADDLDSKWTKEGNYYYYNSKLTKNQSTTSFIQSVTFNEDVTLIGGENCQSNAEANVLTCTTQTGGYAGGTYTLIIKVETVQFDAYQDVWNTNVSIS